MDKSWMNKDRLLDEYNLGVKNFIEIGIHHSKGLNFIWCLCLNCGNTLKQDVDVVRDHLYVHGIDKSYKTWILHGEQVLRDKDESVNTLDEDDYNDVRNTTKLFEAAQYYFTNKCEILTNYYRMHKNFCT